MAGFLESKIETLENGMQILKMPNSVNFVIVTQDKFVVMAKQYRPSVKGQHLNLYGGYIDEGEGDYGALCRELHEETGLRMGIDIREVTPIYRHKLLASGTSTEQSSLFILEAKWNKEALLKLMECKDEKEDIIHEFIPIDANFEFYIKEAVQGVRSFIALDFVSRKYSELKGFKPAEIENELLR